MEICRRLQIRSILGVCEEFANKQSFKDDPLSRQRFCCQKAAYATLGKNLDDGLYLAYCSLPGKLVGGSRCFVVRRG